MAYFIFRKDSDNISGTLYKIAENKSDLDSLNINKDDYKIIEESQSNFDAVKYNIKDIVKYSENTITYEECTPIVYKSKINLKSEIQDLIITIEQFLRNNSNNPQFNKWKDYKDQLNNLNLDSIEYPLNMSLTQYFKNKNLPSLNPLQIP